MGQPTLLAGSSLAHETLERIVRTGLDSSVRVLSVEALSSSQGDSVFGLELERGERVILKVRSNDAQAPFDAEVHQLQHLAGKSPLRVPRVLAHGQSDAESCAFLILERLPGLPWSRVKPTLPPEESAALEWRVGASLACLHSDGRGESFGEVLPQFSPGFRSWPEFFERFWQQRVEQLLRTDRLDTPVLDTVAWVHANLSKLLEIDDVPRLVHGNLDGSKIICEERKEPGGGWRVSGWIDPALAYAHREVDLAALELAGATTPSLFEGYRSELPIDDGYERRKLVYMLYATLDRVRLTGATHDILAAIDFVREVVRRWGS